MAWALAFAGASAAAGLFSAYNGFNSDRHILRDLDKIKKYLKDLKKATNEIKVQNEIILKLLDELPLRVRQIVEEVVDHALLRERYSVVNDIYENFLILRPRPIFGYGINSREWSRFSDAMFYLFEYENRLSHVFDLINICELALAITKNRVQAKVAIKIEDKTDRIQNLYDAQLVLIDSNLFKLKIDLDNTNFIVSHNLSETLENIDDLIITLQPDKTVVQRYSHETRRCVSEGGGGVNGNGGGNYCWTTSEIRTREVLDKVYNSAKEAFYKQILVQVTIIKEQIIHLNYLTGILTTLRQYRNLVSLNSVEALISEEKPIYFSDTFTESDEVIISEIDITDFEEYRSGFTFEDEELTENHNTNMFFSN